MSLKMFCDICDSQLMESARIYTVSGAEVTDRQAHHQTTLIAGIYVDVPMNHTMVCKRCYLVVRKAVENLIQEAKSKAS